MNLLLPCGGNSGKRGNRQPAGKHSQGRGKMAACRDPDCELYESTPQIATLGSRVMRFHWQAIMWWPITSVRRQDQRPAFASTSLDAFDSTSARSSLRETPISESPISSASFVGVTLIRTASRVRDLRDLVPVFKLSSWFDMVAFVYPAELPSRECRLLATMLQLKIEGLTSTLKCAPPHRWNREKHPGGRALT